MAYQVRPVTVSAFVPASPEQVMALIADTRNDPLWCPNVDTAELVTGEPVETGSRFTFRQHLDRPGGKRVEFDAEVEVLELDEHRILWQVTDRFQERQIEVRVEPSKEGTRITQTTRASFNKPLGLQDSSTRFWPDGF